MSNVIDDLFNVPLFKNDQFIKTETEPNITFNDNNKDVVLSVDSSEQDLDLAEKAEDIKLQNQYDAIYKSALDACNKQIEIIDDIDPRLAARNSEVAAQFLSIALGATRERTEAKFKRAKIQLAKQQKLSPSINNATITNNVIVGNRNDVLDLIKTQQKALQTSAPDLIENKDE